MEIRNDLNVESLGINKPEGYIGNIVFPTENVILPAGKLSYATVANDASAQTDRVKGQEASKTLLSDALIDFSTSEIISAYGIDYADSWVMNGIGAIEKRGAIKTIRTVMKDIETAQATQLFTGSAVAYTNILENIYQALKDLKVYSGKTALVCNDVAYNALMQLSEVTAKLALNGWIAKKKDSVLSTQPDILLSMLQNLYNVDVILRGDANCWTNDNKIAICKLPEDVDGSYGFQPELGKTVSYLPSGNLYETMAGKDDKTRTYDFQTVSYIDVVEFNTAKVILDLSV